MDFKLELIAVPVSDVDRAKAFYVDQAGFNADHDQWSTRTCGSSSSHRLAPRARSRSGPASRRPSPVRSRGLQLVVSDIEAARAELAGRGVDVSEIERFPWGAFVFFSDPDGNAWAVQQI